MCHLPPRSYKESWDLGPASCPEKQGRLLLAGQLPQSHLLRWCLEQLLVKGEGTWGPEHSDCSKGEDLFAESIWSFLPTRSKRGKQRPQELILSVDTTAALWREISCSREAGQLLSSRTEYQSAEVSSRGLMKRLFTPCELQEEG